MDESVTLNRDAMERRRLEAAQDLLNGTTQAGVARKFGVSRTTASRWCRTLSGHGMERLRKRKATGRPSRLSPAQMAAVREIFHLSPREFGFDADRWTTARFACAIERRFSIRYDPDHVGRLMHRLGLRSKPASPPAVERPCEIYTLPQPVVEMIM